MRHIISRITQSLGLILLSCSSLLHAYDLPQFYRAPFFYGLNLNVPDKWESLLTVRGASGSSECALDGHGNRVPALNLYGCTDLSRLGLNVETNCDCPKPLTRQYLGKGGVIPSLDLERENGNLTFDGKFKMWEVDIALWQNMMYGLFFYAYVPVRHLELENVACCDCTCSDNMHASTITNFLDNQFCAVLEENGLCPCNTPFSKTGTGDPALMVGWHGSGDMPPGIISDLAGFLGAQISFPISPLRKQNRIFSLPLGYENHWGLGFRLQGEAGIRRWFTLGVTAGTLVFLNKKKCMRMITDCCQTGPIILDRGFADVDPGQLWDIGAYFKADRLLRGLSITLGYSYTKKERTRLAVLDCDFLCSFVEEQCIYGSPLTRVNKNSVVNNAEQLREWDMHTLHFLFELDLESVMKMRFSPVVTFFYNYLFTGRRVYRTDTIGGSFGLHLKWRR